MLDGAFQRLEIEAEASLDSSPTRQLGLGKSSASVIIISEPSAWQISDAYLGIRLAYPLRFREQGRRGERRLDHVL